MNSESNTVEEFSVLRLVLTPGATSEEVVRRTETCAVCHNVEDAFAWAKSYVTEEKDRLAEEARLSGAEEIGAELEILDTEYGYDLLCEERLLVRYWIHEKLMLTT